MSKGQGISSLDISSYLWSKQAEVTAGNVNSSESQLLLRLFLQKIMECWGEDSQDHAQMTHLVTRKAKRTQ